MACKNDRCTCWSRRLANFLMFFLFLFFFSIHSKWSKPNATWESFQKMQRANGDIIVSIYAVSGKEDQNVSSNSIFHKTRGRFCWNLVIVSRINFLQNHVNVFHLTWIMSLHYLVKLKCSLPTCYHWVVREKNSRIYFTLTAASIFARFESIWLQRMGNTTRRVTKHASLISTNWNSDWEQSGPSWIKSSLRQPFVSSVVASGYQRASRPVVDIGHFEHRLWLPSLHCCC